MPVFELKDYEKLARWLEEHTQDAVRRGLTSAGFRLIGVIQNEIIPAKKPPPIFDGAYRAGWKMETTDGGVDVYNDMPYSSVIERGARAENIKIGRAMIDALTEWARRKGLTGHAPRQRSSPEARAEARQIAWAIARAMQKKGIFNRDGQKGLRVAEDAAKRAPEIVEEEIRREMRRGK
jgi:hypothetical protein